MSTTLDHKAPCTNISCQLGLGCPQLWTKKPHVQTLCQLGWGVHCFGPQSPMYKHIMPVRPGVSTTLDHKAPCPNILCQLGWGVHNFGPQSPMYKTYYASLAGVSTTLDQKAPCTKILCQLGCGVHYFGPQSPMCKHIMPVRLGCPLLWTTKPHVQTYHAS